MRVMLKSKLYGLRVTDANLKYDGSITLDFKWMCKADILEYEQVHVLDVSNGNRFVTYAIAGGEGEACVNGAAAHLVEINDELIVLAYAVGDENKLRIVKCEH